MKQTTHIISESSLTLWTKKILQAKGYKESDAQTIATQLVDANIRGVDSHGIMRLPIYIKRIEAGLVDVRAKYSCKKKGSVYIVDAKNTQGQIVGAMCVEKIISLSKKKSMAAAFVKNSTHFGSAGYFARKLAAAGKIGIVFSNAESCVAPYGGTQAVLGTNPLAFAVPTNDFIMNIDFSTSIVSFGNIFLHQNTGESIPRTWGFDKHGQITDNPNDIVALRPMASYKGYALGLMIEVLCGIISSAAFGTNIGNMYTDFSKTQNIGHCFIAIDIASIMPMDIFLERMSALITMLQSSERASERTVESEHETSVRIPGEQSHHTAIQRKKKGIPLSAKVWKELQDIAETQGIALE